MASRALASSLRRLSARNITARTLPAEYVWARSNVHRSVWGRTSVTRFGFCSKIALRGFGTFAPRARNRKLVAAALAGVAVGVVGFVVLERRRQIGLCQEAIDDTEIVVAQGDDQVQAVEVAEEAQIGSAEEPADDSTEESSTGDLKKYRYVIIGGGTAAYAAMRELLARDKDAQILIISEEPHPPYQRPPLSKEMWFNGDPTTMDFYNWAGAKENAFHGQVPENQKDRVTYLFGRKVINLEVDYKAIQLDNEEIILYDKVLIATGGTPRLLPNISQELQKHSPYISTYRTIDDFRHLYHLTARPDVKSITIVGGGWLGCELALALAHRSKTLRGGELRVIHVLPEHGVLANYLPQYLSDYATRRMREAGVDVRTGSYISDVHEQHPRPALGEGPENDTAESPLTLTLNSEQFVNTDHLVVAIGIEPNVRLGKEAGLEVDPVNGGLVVNGELEARSDVFAAGDVSSYYDMVLGRRRVEHFDHAFASGRVAGMNMAGARRPYRFQSMFWSDLEGTEISLNAVGLIDSGLVTHSVWAKPTLQEAERGHPFQRGVVYYLRRGVVVGVLLVNAPHQLQNAYELIYEKKKVNDLSELTSLICLVTAEEKAKMDAEEKQARKRAKEEAKLKAKETTEENTP